MTRTIITPMQTDINLLIPREYVGKRIEVVFFALDDPKEKEFGDFLGFLPESESRKGWAKAAKEFSESGKEETFFADVFEDENLNWWQWKQQ